MTNTTTDDALSRLTKIDDAHPAGADVHIDEAARYVRDARRELAMDHLVAESQRLGLYDVTKPVIAHRSQGQPFSGALEANKAMPDSARAFLDLAFGNGCR